MRAVGRDAAASIAAAERGTSSATPGVAGDDLHVRAVDGEAGVLRVAVGLALELGEPRIRSRARETHRLQVENRREPPARHAQRVVPATVSRSGAETIVELGAAPR